MTLQYAIKTECYIICSTIEQRDRITDMLKANGFHRAGGMYPDQMKISVFPAMKAYGCVDYIPEWKADKIYHASQFLTQGEPPLTC